MIKLKDTINISEKFENYTTKELIYAFITHFLCFLGGIASTRAVVLDKMLPFGISYISGVSYTYLPSAAFGVFFGYLFPASVSSGFRYIAILFAIITIRVLICQYKKIYSNHLFMSCISVVGCILISSVILKIGDITIFDVLCEGILCGFGTYFISRTFLILSKNPSGLSTDELSSILICFSILTMGLNSFGVMSISIGRIISILIILTASKYGGVTAGSVAGIVTSISLSLSGNNPNIGIALSLSGLVSGIFVTLGKYAQITVLILFCFIGAITTANGAIIGITLVEAIIASVIFLTFPKKVAILFGKLFSITQKIAVPYGYKKNLTMRLDLASNALKDVSNTVEQVSNQLSRINSPDFSSIFTIIEQDACFGCKLRVHCFETKRRETIDEILEITKALKQNNQDIDSLFSDEFKGRCLRLNKFGESIKKNYYEYTSKLSAENRIDEIRSVITDQFNGISYMLKDLSEDFKNDAQFDSSYAENCISALKNININVEEGNSRIDKYGRLTLEFKLKNAPELVINKAEVLRAVEIVCERDFDIPRVTKISNEIFIVINEKADIKIDIGVKQLNANESNICGDSYKYFNDGKGHFIMILSDGMGTGGRAAVDGAMASGLMSRLIMAGFGFDCSLRILNSSMMFKSTDESLATLDIANIDLYTGQLKLYKAGAAPSIIRRQGKTGKAESTSLPIGILREASFDKAAIKCRVGDIVVLMSDGVTSAGTDWIRAEIEAHRDSTATDLAERLCECAKRRGDEKHRDDMTVMVAILEKSV